MLYTILKACVEEGLESALAVLTETTGKQTVMKIRKKAMPKIDFRYGRHGFFMLILVKKERWISHVGDQVFQSS